MAQGNGYRQLAQLNIALLVIFQEVISARETKLAAERLLMTPAAVSQGVRRLSALLGAELFVRRDGKITPTARALELAPLVDSIVANARALLCI